MEIYVGNLAYATTDDGLKAAFAQFGEVTAVRVVTDRMTGRSKGFGFVTMPDATQAQAAIDALNGHELDGRTVRVAMAADAAATVIVAAMAIVALVARLAGNRWFVD